MIDRHPHADQINIFRLLAPSLAADVPGFAHVDAGRQLIAHLTAVEAAARLERRPMDDVAKILAEDVPEVKLEWMMSVGVMVDRRNGGNT